MVYSHAGIITEMYDHINYEENQFGFTGFLAGGAAAYSPSTRRELVLEQLALLLGAAAKTPTAYIDKVWTYFNGKLFFCGTETTALHGGYMDGAVAAAQHVAALLGPAG